MNVMSVLNQIMNQAQGGQSRQGSQGGMDVNQMMGNLGTLTAKQNAERHWIKY